MNILKTFWFGIQTTNQKIKIVVYLWLFNFVFSLLIVTPIYYFINRDLSRSLMADRLAKGINFLWLGDVIYKYRDVLSALLGWFLVPGVLFFLLHIFLNGGVLGRIVAENEKINLANFFADCGKYFFRFIRIFLISIPGYLVIFGLIFTPISVLLNLWKKSASSEWDLIFVSNLRFLLLLLLFSVIKMFFDYVKIRCVAKDSNKTIRETLFNLSFLGKRFFRAWALYLLVGLAMVLFFVVYLLVDQPLPKMGFLLFFALTWQQVYILTKMWIKVLFFSTEYQFYNTYREAEKQVFSESMSKK